MGNNVIECNDLLIELGTEELPPKALSRLMESFAHSIREYLGAQGLAFESVRPLASPRRLAVIVSALAGQQADQTVEKKGPTLVAAYDREGNPSKAAIGFARSCGVEFDALESIKTDKGEWLFHRSSHKGRALDEIVGPMIKSALDQLPIPKRMHWGSRRALFVRPAHWLVVLYGNRVLPCEALGLTAGRTSYGHRFHAPDAITIESPSSYEAQLQHAYVVADFFARRTQIAESAHRIANEMGATLSIAAELLDEVTGLVEWPIPLVGNFDPEFLSVPQEALISTMESNQKYFPLFDNTGKLLNRFITIANIESTHPDRVIAGNERVVRPRLSDARFFFETDQKQRLEDHAELQQKVVFEKQLGSVDEKSVRNSALAREIAQVIGGEPGLAKRAGRLAKADLASNMVGEFPELQGVMGEYYALGQGEPKDVATAIREHYLPRYSGDAMPATLTGSAVALADKVDSLIGILGIGKIPSGDKDPYALRRAAIGVLRIVVENRFGISLSMLAEASISLYSSRLTNPNVKQDFLEFIRARIPGYFAEQGIASDTVRAVLAVSSDAPSDIMERAIGVTEFRTYPEAAALAAANKRVRNILEKRTDNGSQAVDGALLKESAEVELFHRLAETREKLTTLRGNYSAQLKTLAELRTPVDNFFEKVLVNAESPEVRTNRLNLLANLQELFLGIADIAELQ
ncbi:Glycyl-tRNA synthetase beta chain [gamma proteobacterium HdN1]|nr:Glycyl-tRNA synthetase beta chain [gamma proteobacterium HdN1]